MPLTPVVALPRSWERVEGLGWRLALPGGGASVVVERDDLPPDATLASYVDAQIRLLATLVPDLDAAVARARADDGEVVTVETEQRALGEPTYRQRQTYARRADGVVEIVTCTAATAAWSVVEDTFADVVVQARRALATPAGPPPADAPRGADP